MWALLACAEVLSDPTPYVTDARVVAVQVEPAEAEPDEPIVVRTLYADANGALTEAEVDWAFCLARRPLAEPGPVSSECLDPSSDTLSPIGTGLEVSGVLPSDACSLFGPNPPPAEDGEPAGRPVDADVTGGFYQPVLGFDAGTTLVSARVRCGLANVTQETYIAWNVAYRSNTNPIADTFEAPASVAPGEAVTLTVGWPECTTEEPCGGAEDYTLYDPELRELTTRREAISAAWFATAGTFADARNGRDGEDSALDVTNTWTAPETPGEVWLAVVLRDERGGVGWADVRVNVE